MASSSIWVPPFATTCSYDLTSTYFEGRLEHNPKARRSYSRDHRPDCKQACIGLALDWKIPEQYLLPNLEADARRVV